MIADKILMMWMRWKKKTVMVKVAMTMEDEDGDCDGDDGGVANNEQNG